ncbi:MAG: RDD family protein [Candidatus Hermodarchaeota archaeon]
MGKYEDLNQIDQYINEVNGFLPYPKSKKFEALEELRIDVQAAMKDSQGETPSMVFGNPRDVAINLSQSHDWHDERARWRTRLFAWFLDLIIEIGLILCLLGIGFLVLVFTIIPFDELVGEFSKWEQGTITVSTQVLLMIIFITILLIIAFIVWLGYNAAFEYYFGATIGKRLLNLMVVDQDGVRISWKQAIIRNLSKLYVSEELLPLDVILGMILERMDPVKARNQRGLDILAETIVIKV